MKKTDTKEQSTETARGKDAEDLCKMWPRLAREKLNNDRRTKAMMICMHDTMHAMTGTRCNEAVLCLVIARFVVILLMFVASVQHEHELSVMVSCPPWTF